MINMRSGIRASLRPESEYLRADFGPERVDFRPEWANFGSVS